MRFDLILFCCGLLFTAASALPAALDPAPLTEVDKAVTASIEKKEIPGAVVWIESSGGRYVKAYGSRQVDPNVKAMLPQTMFDLASLTKVVATTPAVMKLVELGKVDLEAPVSAYIKEFTGDGRDAIKVRHLLTHLSGLPPGIARHPAWSGYATGIAKACAEPLRHEPGSKFLYSDINFILLGEIVRRTSDTRLDWFLRKNVFDPCGMTHTMFLPGAKYRWRIAPTTREKKGSGGVVLGVVHDPTSRCMGGVTGHAGCFSTAADLAKYARMILRGGVADNGRRIFKAETIKAMTSIQTPSALPQKRGFGWDIDTGFSEPRGELFPINTSFGHTGWTGTSIWIDPVSKSFVIILTNRNHPTEKGRTKELRFKVATLAAQAIGLKKPEAAADSAAASAPVGAHGPKGPGKVRNGIDALEAEPFKSLAGMRIGLVTNQTGVDAEGTSTADLLSRAPNVRLTALFSPEHGIRGKLDTAKISDSKDEKTGLPIFSLYGKIRKPTAEQLKGLDALVFDLQDIGCRFYTYIATMLECMEAAAENQISFVVLDRINPIGGKIEGPLLIGKTDFVGCHPIPVRHGMTVGELAQMFAAENKLKLNLRIIRLEGWQRNLWQDQTGLPWINPSPNMRSLTAAALYPGVGLLEFTNVSVGRGTATPFEVFGAPWIDAKKLVADLSGQELPGIRFSETDFTPTASVFAGQVCHGVRFVLTDRNACNSVDLGICLAAALQRNHPGTFQIDKMNRLLFHPPSLTALKAGKPPAEIVGGWADEVKAFAKRRRPFLLYGE